MNTVLVTGGAGFIGSCLVRQLIRQDHCRVVNYDKLTYAGNLESLGTVLHHPRHAFVQGDVCDLEHFSQVLQATRPLAVIHLAAESHVDRSIDAPDEFVQTNVVGTTLVLKASLGYWEQLDTIERNSFRFVLVSTDEVYGSAGPTEYFSEQTCLRPNSPYAASKAAANHLARAYWKTYGLPVLTTNCSNNYGPYQFPEKLIPLTIVNALARRPLPVYGDGQNVRDWIYVADHCQALRQVLKNGSPGEVYNIGGGCLRTNLEVVTAVCDQIDQRAPSPADFPRTQLITFVDDRPGHDQRYAIDCTKIVHQLGWRPRQSWQSGLARTVRWYIDHHEWIDRVRSRGYQQQRLGLRGACRIAEGVR